MKTYYIPEGLDIDTILKQHPVSFKWHPDYFAYLLGQINEVASNIRDTIDDDGYVPLYAPFLKLRVHNYNEYMDYLVDAGIIERTDTYQAGERSKGYRFALPYRNQPLKPVQISKYTLLKKIKAQNAYDKGMKAKYDYLYKWFTPELTIDFNKAEEALELIKIENILRCKPNPFEKYNAHWTTAAKIRDKEFHFRVDTVAGRLHTNLTTLKKELRPFISYDGMTLASIDVVSSQPTLISALLSPTFYEKHGDETVSFLDTIAPIRKMIDLPSVWKHIKENYPDTELFRTDALNDFYTSFQKRVGEKINGYEVSRGDIKKSVFQVLYSHNNFINQKNAWLKRLFKETYPGTYSILEAFKKEPKALPLLMQNLEAQLVLDRVAKAAAKHAPGMPLFTVHDSIVVPFKEAGWCMELFRNVYKNTIGIIPNLRVEIWAHSQQST